MSGEAVTVSRLRHACAVLLGCLLIVVGVAATALARPPELIDMQLPLLAVLAVMVPAYIAGNKYTLDFEFRRDAHAVTLVQLPLALGVFLVAPLIHLAARVVATIVFVISDRQPPVKVAYNLGVSAIEVGAATLAVSLVAPSTGPSYWLALYAGLVIGDAAGAVVLGAIWRLLGIPSGGGMTIRAMATTAPVALMFTGIAVVSVTAVASELWTAPLLLGLVAGLVLAYRAHRRIVTQQQATELLYDFVKDLGPLDLHDPEVDQVLQRVRSLVHTRQLDLVVRQGDVWHHLRVSDDGGTVRSLEHRRPPALQVTTTEAALVRGGQGNADTMATPLVGAAGLTGVLTATQRLGAARGFDMRDLRLLETVGSELSIALERGRLLGDLGRAATTDPLTGLPNLAQTTRLLADLLSKSPQGVVLAAIAVDSFREVNDTLGHQVGDELLVEVSSRLITARPGAVIGRIGGGRFAVALPLASDDHDPELVGLGLRSQVEGRAQLGAVGTHIKLSVGVALAPDHGREAATLIRRAETAMYSARHAHGGPVLWEPAYEVTGTRRLAVVTALREALSSGAIGVAYQPKIDAASGDVCGVEALARWTHPALGAISPDEFIPLAEASGLMGPLTATVMRQSLTACKGWQRRAPNVGVAVNVSAGSVLDPSFITEVASALTLAGVPAQVLTLELTESVLVDDPVLAATRIGELRALGVKLSVDDFGTGYSSLTYLKGLPVDEVKIDKGFIRGLIDDPADRAVVRAVVDIAHTLGLSVVAEGVEHEAQNGILRALGVDVLQGFLHARPMPALEVGAWLKRRESSHQV